ncbi:membrane protein [Staphylococcus condimenti]|nr:membrane protein [Staphylococcus condimenti]
MKKAVNSMRNRLVAIIVFTIMSVVVLVISGYINNTKSVDLSELKINNMKVNEKFNEKGFKINHEIQIDRYRFYYNEKHPNLMVKIDKKSHRIKGIMLIKDSKIGTNKNFTVGDSIDDAIQALGSSYQLSKGKNGYKTLTYSDKGDHLSLKILYQDDEIRRIEFFKW